MRGDPTILIECSVANNLEILGLLSFGYESIRERVTHAHTRQRDLSYAVHSRGHRDPNGFVNRRRDVDHVMELRTDGSDVFDLRRPGDYGPGARAAKMTRDLLGPLKRRVDGPGPANGEVVFMLRSPDFIKRLEHRRHVVGEAVLSCHIVQRACQASFRAATVVACDADDQRVVCIRSFADCSE